MPTDTELLNFLEEMGRQSNLKWLARPSITGRGWRLHQDPQGEHKTARAALLAAMTAFNQTERKWCYYCQVNSHNDSECHRTRPKDWLRR